MNLNLGSNQSRNSNNTNTNDFDHMKEQQPVMNVIYENNNSDNSNSNVETSREHVFSSQLDSFEMDHIALQSDAEIDIGLDTRNSTNMASTLR